nr:NAD-dependent DNA ligase LigA [uncultured Oscillibacter sp.]
MEKTKSIEELFSFIGDQLIMLMLKLDGLTIKLTYEDGVLVEASTRGDGNEGEIVTHNTRGITGIPMQIPYKGRLIVTGEAFNRPSDFEAMKATPLDSTGKPYKNGRNLAAGSVRLLDASACKNRRITFMPFNVLEGFQRYERKSDKLYTLKSMGFALCEFRVANRALTQKELEDGIQALKQFAKEHDIPIDGIVTTYNNIAFSKGCGRTGHHYKDGLAFKFEDDLFKTKLQAIEWNPGRTGEIAPAAIFEPVEIDGCIVSRASLHNLSFIEGLELMPGNRVLVSKRNMIILHVEENLDRGGFDIGQVAPAACPCCGQPTRIHENSNVKTLFCDNPDCETRRLRQFVHFASQKAMDIEGLSEATLERFIGKRWLHSPMDIYRLDKYQTDIVRMDGFGEKSWQRLWNAIQNSRETTFERYLIAMDIPMIGNTASRTLAQQFHSSLDEFEEAVNGGFDFTKLPDFGETLQQNIRQWFQTEENWEIWLGLRELVHIAPPAVPEATQIQSNPFVGKTIVVTGKVEPYTRTGINAKIEALGAHAGSSVSGKTGYLICGENAGSKLDRARSLNVTVLTPAQFFEMAGM